MRWDECSWKPNYDVTCLLYVMKFSSVCSSNLWNHVKIATHAWTYIHANIYSAFASNKQWYDGHLALDYFLIQWWKHLQGWSDSAQDRTAKERMNAPVDCVYSVLNKNEMLVSLFLNVFILICQHYVLSVKAECLRPSLGARFFPEASERSAVACWLTLTAKLSSCFDVSLGKRAVYLQMDWQMDMCFL